MRSGFGGGNFYALTASGLRACYQLFHVKFSPEVSGEYHRVRPACGVCECNEAGHIRMLGGAAAVPPPAARAAAGIRHAVDLLGDVDRYDFDPYGGFGGLDEDEGFAPVHTPIRGNKRARGTPTTAVAEDYPLHDQMATLSADDVAQLRAKRARYYADLTTTTAKKTTPTPATSSRTVPNSSSAKNPIQLDTTPPLALPTATAGTSDSQDPDLQALLEYSEREALIAETRRQAREEMQLELAIQSSNSNSNASGSTSNRGSGSSVPINSASQQKYYSYTDYDDISDTEYRVPERYAQVIGKEGQTDDYFSEQETFGEDEEEQYQRAIAESLALAERGGGTGVSSSSGITSGSRRSAKAGTSGAFDRDFSSTSSSVPRPKSKANDDAVVVLDASSLLSLRSGATTSHVPTLSAMANPVGLSDRGATPIMLQTRRSGSTTATAVHSSAGTPVIVLDDSPEHTFSTTTAAHARPRTSPSYSHTPSSSQSSAGSQPRDAVSAQWNSQKSRSTLPVVLELDESPSPITHNPPLRKSDRDGRQGEVITIEDSQVLEEMDTTTEVVLPDTPDIGTLEVVPSRTSEVVCLEDSQDLEAHPDWMGGTATSASSSSASKAKSSCAAAMLASFRSLQGTPSANNRGKALPAAAAAVPVTVAVALPAPPTHLISYVSATNTTTATARVPNNTPLISMQEVPQSADDRLVLLVDTRERFQQARYRQFFFDIQSQCTAHLPAANPIQEQQQQGRVSWKVEQEGLKLGDIAFAYECTQPSAGSNAHIYPKYKSKTSSANSPLPDTSTAADSALWLTGTVIERKALSDLISSSTGDARTRCGTARHFTQETRLRHCGLQNTFMLLEGHANMASVHTVPLVWRETDYSHPDVVETAEDIVSYMCAVLARNYSPSSMVRVLQTYRNGATALLYAAFMAVELYYTQLTRGDTKHCTSKLAFDQYCTSLGGEKRGREALLRRDLCNNGVQQATVSAEMAERVIRRFGCWEALLAAYRSCWLASWADTHCGADSDRQAAAELRCALLLCELSVGGTRTARHALTTTTTAAEYYSDENSGIDIADNNSTSTATSLRRDSVHVWLRARSRLLGALQPPPSTQYTEQWEAYLLRATECVIPTKVTHLTLSASMTSSYLSGYTVLNSTSFICQVQEAPTLTGTSSSSNGKGLTINAANAQAHADGNYPYLYLQSMDKNEYFYLQQQHSNDTSSNSSSGRNKVHRISQRMCVAVVSGDDVVETLVAATSAYISAHPHYEGNLFAEPARSVAIIRNALTGLSKHLPKEFTATTVPGAQQQLGESPVPVQCVLVVEGLVHPTLATASAMGRLSARISELSGSSIGGYSNSSNCSGGAVCTVSLGPQRRELDAASARIVSANAAWLSQMLLATVSQLGLSPHLPGSSSSSTQGSAATAVLDSNTLLTTREGYTGCKQCLLSANADQTERYLYGLIHETHRQSLLLY